MADSLQPERRITMNTQHQQRGFIDVGLGLGIIALFGGVIVTELSQPDDASNNFPACSEYTEEQLVEYIDSGLHCE